MSATSAGARVPVVGGPGAAALRLMRSPALLRVVAVLAAVVIPGAVLLVAGDTLGYDFRAYHAAALRVLGGAPAYDLSYVVAGPYGLFLYPPTFLPFVLPFALLDVTAATWLWTALLAGATVFGIARMPVRAQTRWLVLLLAAQSWPAVYALKLGQVGGFLVLLFVEGWRAIEESHPGGDPGGDRVGGRVGKTGRGAVLGITGALGAAIKLQPGLVLVWALVTRRFTAVIAGAATLAVLALLATLIGGPTVWTGFVTIITRVTDAVGTPHNFTPGAVALGLGATHDAATLVQTGSMALVLAVVGWSVLRLPATPSNLVAVVATQLLSPVLWDHYAIVLLVPVAWLLDRGWRWAVVVPLATSVFVIGLLPPITYPAVFALTLVLLVAEGRRKSASALGRY